MAWSKPSDGYAYNPTELDAIAHLRVPDNDIIDGRRKRRRFYQYAGDLDIADLILRAMLADLIDPEPEGLITDCDTFVLPIDHPDLYTGHNFIGEERPE